MSGKSSEETLQDKEYYYCLTATNGARVYAYRDYRGRFTETLLEEIF